MATPLPAVFIFMVLITMIHVDEVNGVRPAYSPAMEGLHVVRHADLVNLVYEYFMAGYTVPVICAFLFYKHGVKRSVRHIKRILAMLGLRRRCPESAEADVIHAIRVELCGSGSCCGYRAMWQRLCRLHLLQVKRETVRRLLRVLDPDGVEARTSRRFRRRMYRNKGPNYLIHVDGYDKLKPFGFAIHGAIDGFSRRILWLEVGSTNNNPKVVAKYLLDYVQEIQGVPHVIRTDRGTENTLIQDIQVAFRYYDDDERSGFNSFMFGKSTANQRIERWWGSLRSGAVDFWIRLFRDMCDFGVLDNSCRWQIDCLRFCFTGVLRAELQCVAQLWNEHHIRSCKNTTTPHGKPDEMYFLPQIYGTHDYKHDVTADDVAAVRTTCIEENVYCCSLEFAELGEYIVQENGLTMPHTSNEALLLFLYLKQVILNLLDE